MKENCKVILLALGIVVIYMLLTLKVNVWCSEISEDEMAEHMKNGKVIEYFKGKGKSGKRRRRHNRHLGPIRRYYGDYFPIPWYYSYWNPYYRPCRWVTFGDGKIYCISGLESYYNY